MYGEVNNPTARSEYLSAQLIQAISGYTWHLALNRAGLPTG